MVGAGALGVGVGVTAGVGLVFSIRLSSDMITLFLETSGAYLRPAIAGLAGTGSLTSVLTSLCAKVIIAWLIGRFF